MSDANHNKPQTNANGNLEFEPIATMRYDNYRSVRDSNLLIFVANDVVPPFRFKAGGWELLQSSIELGAAIRARVAENDFFMVRINEDKAGWTELSDPQTPLVRVKTQSQKISEVNQESNKQIKERDSYLYSAALALSQSMMTIVKPETSGSSDVEGDAGT